MAILILENFIFGHLEIPPKINFGGPQITKTHILSGGARVVDAMGPNPDPIKWGGYFDGLDAVARARYLDNLKNNGKPVNLTYNNFSYKVLISSFTCDFQAPPLPYEITVIVIVDNTFPISIIAPLGFTDAIIGAIVQAQQLALLLADGNIIDKIAALYAAANAVGDLAQASQAEINNLSSLTTASLSATSSYITPVKASLFGN